MIPLLVKASLVIIILLAFYKIFLEKESFFAANRIYLLGCLVASCTLPFIELPKLMERQGFVTTLLESSEEKEVNSSGTTDISIEKLNNLPKTALSMDGETVSKLTPTILEKEGPSASQGNAPKQVISNTKTASSETLVTKDQPTVKGFSFWLILLYFFGVAVLSINLLAQIVHTFWKIYKNEDKIEDKDCVLVNMKSNIEPSSFFKYIFINPKSYDYDTYEQIIAHEKIHIRQGHTLDLLLSELATIAFWFNPFIWVLRKEVEKNIEYQTDDLLVKEEKGAKENYQLNLLKIATYTKPLNITTSYNQSLIKQRILKMNSQKSNQYRYWKYTFVAPVLFMLLLFLNEPKLGNAQSFMVPTISNTIPIDTLEHKNLIATPIADVSEEEVISDQDNEIRTEADQPLKPEPIEQRESSVESTTVAVPDCKKLTNAIREQNIDEVKILLNDVDANCIDHGAAPELIPTKGLIFQAKTPLIAAARLGNVEIGKLLVEAGAKLTLDPNGSENPLLEAAMQGHLDFVKFLVEEGININTVSKNKTSALHRAAGSGHLEVVAYLIQQGADINVRDDGQYTPLHEAARRYIEIVAFLIEHGADVNAESAWQRTALSEAALYGQDEIMKLLLSKGVDIEAQRDLALIIAAEGVYSQTSTIELLLAKGANINAQNNRDGSPLSTAARNRRDKKVELLLAKGADINAQTEGQGTALNAAARYGHDTTVELLLAKGADIDKQNYGRGSALYAAAKMGHLSTVKLLVSKGANVNLRIKGKGTAIAVAKQNGHEQVVEYLKTKDAEYFNND